MNGANPNTPPSPQQLWLIQGQDTIILMSLPGYQYVLPYLRDTTPPPLPSLEDSTCRTKISSSSKTCTQFYTLLSKILHKIDTWHSSLVHHKTFKKVLARQNRKNPPICSTRYYKLKYPHLTAIHITKTSITRGRTDFYPLTHPSVTVFLPPSRDILIPKNASK